MTTHWRHKESKACAFVPHLNGPCSLQARTFHSMCPGFSTSKVPAGSCSHACGRAHGEDGGCAGNNCGRLLELAKCRSAIPSGNMLPLARGAHDEARSRAFGSRLVQVQLSRPCLLHARHPHQRCPVGVSVVGQQLDHGHGPMLGEELPHKPLRVRRRQATHKELVLVAQASRGASAMRGNVLKLLLVPFHLEVHWRTNLEHLAVSK
mmetsp:Transcript_15220/g.47982  ORF Transcript_15220/g.47982 Transcript_15220/m.47982 type:complete len:207 (+) Transcript_15220:1831-2451(+)